MLFGEKGIMEPFAVYNWMKSFLSTSIRRKILSMFILISIVSIAVISTVAVFQFRGSFSEKSVADYEKIAEELYYNLNRVIIKGRTDVSLIANNPVIASNRFSPDQKKEELLKLKWMLKIYEDITIVNAKGIVVTSTDYNYRGDWRYKRHFLESLKGKTIVSNVQSIASPEKYIIDFSSPVFDKHKKIISIITTQLNMKNISDIITHVEIEKTGHAFLLNENYKIIAHKEKEKMFLKHCQSLNDQISSGNDYLKFSDQDGTQFFGAYFNVSKLTNTMISSSENINWTVVVLQENNEMLSPLNSIVWRLMLFAVLLGSIAIVLLVFFSRTITEPIRHLSEGAAILGKGNLDHRVEIETEDELKKLANSFNEMAANLFNSKQEITEREADLKKANNYISNIINSMPSILVGVDAKGRITQWNKKAEETTGIKKNEAKGRLLPEVFPQMASEMDNVMESMATNEIKVESKKPYNNKTQYMDITIYPLVSDGVEGAVVRIDDVTSYYNLEQQLNQHRKMDAIGQLVGGVAHDFNNLLAGILGAAEMLKNKGNDGRKTVKYVDMIILASTRAAELISKLLAFSRKGAIVFTPVDIHDILNDVSVILERSIDKKIEIQINNNAEQSVVVGDSSQLQNVFMNIGINASHAMPDGGEVSFTTSILKLEKIACNEMPFDIEPGCFIEIEIRDRGCGISSENIHKIFEPFFSTKEQGEGTGLGLAAVYGTIQDHHGAVNVSSELGVGTVFRIYLPLSDKVVEKTTGDVKALRGAGQILIVDDEEIIRTTARVMLEDLNYSVITAENGKEAVAVFQEKYKDIDLVLLDMIMPEMNGRDTFKKMREVDDNCRIIISSGFSKDEDLDDLMQRGLDGFIRKPYRKFELSQLLAKVLNKKSNDE